MTSLLVDIGMLVGVLAYSGYLITLLIRYRSLEGNGAVEFNPTRIAETQMVNRLTWAPVSNVKTSLAFQRVARRV
jgi:hypothetical protein